MPQNQMKVDADRAWECLVPTGRTRAMRRRKLPGAGWDNGPHSVTKRRSAGLVLLNSAFGLSLERSNAKTGQLSALFSPTVNQLQSLLYAG